MVSDRIQRRLAAILAADVVGYSRLMETDEAGTLAVLKARRKDVLDPLVSKHQGRVFKTTGDGVMVEFASAVNAVQCAVELQQGMAAANREQPEDHHIVLRIGVNLGDVMVEGGDLYGDGVNIAARLEGIAEPGGVCVSGSAFDYVRNKVKAGFDDLGPQSLKNIAEPVRAFRIAGNPAAARATTSGKPTILVLPFTNMSGDPEQEFFSDGITEDIITDLSRISALSVVARNTAFTFKGKSVDVAQVARQLRVDHILEGSVRKSGGRVRITAQLIDGRKGDHRWAERYDRDLSDIFALQDEISRSIVGALKLRLVPGDVETGAARSTTNPEAYEVFLLGRHFFNSGHRIQALKTARRLFAKAIEIDPGYARAYAALAGCDSQLLLVNDASARVEDILANSNRALELQPGLADAHAARGEALNVIGQRQKAEAEFETALKLDPNCFDAHYCYARFCLIWGSYEKAAAHYLRAAELRSDDFRSLAQADAAYRALGQLDKGRAALRQSVERIERELKIQPDNTDALSLGSVLLAELGDMERADSWAARAALLIEQGPTDWYNLACFYLKAGKTDRALDCVERIVSGQPENFAEWMRRDTDVDAIRDHPRFQAVLARMDAEAVARRKTK
jgi:adenylate cyclase